MGSDIVCEIEDMVRSSGSPSVNGCGRDELGVILSLPMYTTGSKINKWKGLIIKVCHKTLGTAYLSTPSNRSLLKRLHA